METVYKTMAVVFIWAITAPAFFSILVSLAAIFYFVSMLYFKVVKVHFKGSWRAYFKSIYRYFKKD